MREKGRDREIWRERESESERRREIEKDGERERERESRVLGEGAVEISRKPIAFVCAWSLTALCKIRGF